MSFTKLSPIKGTIACATCGCGSHDTFGMEDIVAVGFGSAMVTKDDEIVFDERAELHAAKREGRDAMLWEGKDCEAAAEKDPDHDWRIHLVAPLYEATYQRQGPKHWVLVAKGEGFA